MNYYHSPEFNAGFIWNKIERSIGLMMSQKQDSCTDRIYLPKIQISPKAFTLGEVQYIAGNVAKINNIIIDTFNAVYGKRFEIDLTDSMCSANVKFVYTIRCKPAHKEMTIEEIESVLGYKIKIIGGTEQ